MNASGIISILDVSPVSLTLDSKGIQCWGTWITSGAKSTCVIHHWPAMLEDKISSYHQYSLSEIFSHPSISRVKMWVHNQIPKLQIDKTDFMNWLRSDADKHSGYRPLPIHRAQLVYDNDTRQEMKYPSLSFHSQQFRLRNWLASTLGIDCVSTPDVFSSLAVLANHDNPYIVLHTWLQLGVKTLQQQLGPDYIESSWVQLVEKYGLSQNSKLSALSMTMTPDNELTALACAWLSVLQQNEMLSEVMVEEYNELRN